MQHLLLPGDLGQFPLDLGAQADRASTFTLILPSRTAWHAAQTLAVASAWVRVSNTAILVTGSGKVPVTATIKT
ncbi:hypothetical protein [Longispora fulva]|uniref:Uncharacterized protein n=1 Tax=Longispora fulva TaxID=619741 RepID=A0A8J7KGW3_9ACTN|nr:hypothetical protein [Longispora fulva]MBG6137820.1 hypothetical protein [Longispora fulva]